MDTPWGPLSTLDPADHELAARILATDKHQLVEGLVVESLFDQIVDALPTSGEALMHVLDIETIVVDTSRASERWIVFVWARTRGPGLGRYLRALNAFFVPYLLELREGMFYAAKTSDGAIVGPKLPLPDLMTDISRRHRRNVVVDTNVRDHARQQQAFWGFLSAQYKEKLWAEVVLPRILINHGIQPYFRAVWNLDRAMLAGDTIWLGEIKHKYPFDHDGFHFGLNTGELTVIDRLSKCDIRCLHTILVKPRWSKDEGSMYLLNDLAMKSRAAFIGCVFEGDAAARVIASPASRSAKHTSFTGKSTLSYNSLPATGFSRLGTLAEAPAILAANMWGLMIGNSLDAVTDAWLRGHRVPR
jgi:hypothetical protein